jgi:hypothetical protein
MNSDDLTNSLRELAHRSEYLGWRALLTETCESANPLKEAAQAHRDLESRKTTGSIILLP